MPSQQLRWICSWKDCGRDFEDERDAREHEENHRRRVVSDFLDENWPASDEVFWIDTVDDAMAVVTAVKALLFAERKRIEGRDSQDTSGLKK